MHRRRLRRLSPLHLPKRAPRHQHQAQTAQHRKRRKTTTTQATDAFGRIPITHSHLTESTCSRSHGGEDPKLRQLTSLYNVNCLNFGWGG
jgi:hypothetical protein